MEYLWNCYLVKMRGGRARLEKKLIKAITFDLTYVLSLNFYRTFRKSFSIECL
jgi:hypothetical protein